MWIMIDGDLRYAIAKLDAPLVKQHYYSYFDSDGLLVRVPTRKTWDAGIMTDKSLALLLRKCFVELEPVTVDIEFGKGDITTARGKGIISSITDTDDRHHFTVYGDGPLEVYHEKNTG